MYNLGFARITGELVHDAPYENVFNTHLDFG